ncbi:MAG: DUF3995 domain-containing protein [Saprospiraceae bacterium]|nr:DUF3995 domain-containing protein [Saprospiraceae bacterium]
MTTIAALILIIIFTFLSGMHIYWAFGGRWASEGVFPTFENQSNAVMPGMIPTLIVAVGLLFFGLMVLMHITDVTLPFGHEIIYKYGLRVIAVIFIIRSIGEFQYVGLFKKIKHTKFGLKDTQIYTPLCLTIGILALILEFYK